MATILHIETSTTVCSVSLSQNTKSIKQLADKQGQNHSKILPLFLKEILIDIKRNNTKIDAVAVSRGPGSYTGLRIGVSMAKGLCFGWDLPLIAVDTLAVLSQGLLSSNEIEHDALLCPMLDARRMEVYTAVYDTNLQLLKKTSAEIITENSFADLLPKHHIYFFGNGAEKCATLLQHENATFIPDINPVAEYMIPMAEKAFAEKKFENTAYFEPLYLKEFIATTSKKNILK